MGLGLVRLRTRDVVAEQARDFRRRIRSSLPLTTYQILNTDGASTMCTRPRRTQLVSLSLFTRHGNVMVASALL
jgi:hypothetical protein